jgi:uncharacterized protein YndB with AHSA1/START domain
MFKKILLVVAGLLVALLIVIALQPSRFSITRTGTINAAPEMVFPYINNLQRWEAWSPWAKLDPAAKNTFEGPQEGTGAIFRWAGNEKVGEGVMTITESKPPELVRLRLEFIEPMPGVSTTEFTFAKVDAGTTVTWTMSGENDFLGKAFCLFMNMDKMVGKDFEQGLANLKKVAEAAPAKP